MREMDLRGRRGPIGYRNSAKKRLTPANKGHPDLNSTKLIPECIQRSAGLKPGVWGNLNTVGIIR